MLNPSWETQVEKLVQIIKEDRRKGVESLSSPFSSPESSLLSGRTESRVLSSLSRVPLESESSPRRSEKSARRTREDPRRCESSLCRVRRVPRSRESVSLLSHRKPKRFLQPLRVERILKQPLQGIYSHCCSVRPRDLGSEIESCLSMASCGGQGWQQALVRISHRF